MLRLCLFAALALASCSTSSPETSTARPEGADASGTPVGDDSGEAEPEMDGDPRADVTGVAANGSAGSYTFSVTLFSPDTGCEQYADWWEVLDRDGALLYRRILGHSHVDEQPFTRSGGPVDVAADQVVFVRAHLAPSGYGGDVFTGTPDGGFALAEQVPTIDPAIETAQPQPDGCAF